MATKTDAFAEATRKEIHMVVAELLADLGPTAIQAMTGTRDRSMPSRWAKEDGPRPQTTTVERLRLGYRVWLMLSEEGPRVAAAWMIGANPLLGEDTPLTAVRENRVAEVVAAAEAFTTDAFSG